MLTSADVAVDSFVLSIRDSSVMTMHSFTMRNSFLWILLQNSISKRAVFGANGLKGRTWSVTPQLHGMLIFPLVLKPPSPSEAELHSTSPTA